MEKNLVSSVVWTKLAFNIAKFFSPPSSLSSRSLLSSLISDAHFSLVLALKRKISLSNFFLFLADTGFSSLSSSYFFSRCLKQTSNEKKILQLRVILQKYKLFRLRKRYSFLLQKCQNTTIKASRNERNSKELIEWLWCEQRHHEGVVCGHFYDVIS